jgi:hypothetical protein
MSRDFFEDEQWRKGYEFEKWVRARMPENFWKLLDWRGDKCVSGFRPPVSAKYPDLEFEDNTGQFRIAIECKWRDHYDAAIDPEKIQRYRDYEIASRTPVHLVMGISGTPSAPYRVYICPLNQYENTMLRRKDGCSTLKAPNADSAFFFHRELQEFKTLGSEERAWSLSSS